MPAHRIVNVKRWKPEETAACAYIRKGDILIHGSSITEIGGLNCPPYQLLTRGITDAQLGATLLETLATAKAAPPPSDLTSEQEKLFAVAKVRSWTKLNDGAAYCHVGMTPREITIVPTKYEGRGFTHLPDQSIKLSAASTAQELGAAMREGFSRCTRAQGCR